RTAPRRQHRDRRPPRAAAGTRCGPAAPGWCGDRGAGAARWRGAHRRMVRLGARGRGRRRRARRRRGLDGGGALARRRALVRPPAAHMIRPPGPFRPEFWRSPLRGPWLTSALGSLLLPLLLIV